MNEQFHYVVVAQIVNGQPAFYCDPSLSISDDRTIWNDETGEWREINSTDDDRLDNDFIQALNARLASEPTIKVSALAELLDECADADGEWDGGDVCQAIADLILRHNGFSHCITHGVYAASKPRCPFNHQAGHTEGETDYGV